MFGDNGKNSSDAWGKRGGREVCYTQEESK